MAGSNGLQFSTAPEPLSPLPLLGGQHETSTNDELRLELGAPVMLTGPQLRARERDAFNASIFTQRLSMH